MQLRLLDDDALAFFADENARRRTECRHAGALAEGKSAHTGQQMRRALLHCAALLCSSTILAGCRYGAPTGRHRFPARDTSRR